MSVSPVSECSVECGQISSVTGVRVKVCVCVVLWLIVIISVRPSLRLPVCVRAFMCALRDLCTTRSADFAAAAAADDDDDDDDDNGRRCKKSSRKNFLKNILKRW